MSTLDQLLGSYRTGALSEREKVEIWGDVKDGMVGWHNRWFYP